MAGEKPRDSLPSGLYSVQSTARGGSISRFFDPRPPPQGGSRAVGLEKVESEDGLDTDSKLAILQSLFVERVFEHEELLEVLVHAGGDVEKAAECLRQADYSHTVPHHRFKRAKKSAPGRIASTQCSLSAYLPRTEDPSAKSNSGLPKPIKGKPLLLFSPEHVAALTPCTLITNFFPPNLANELLQEMVRASACFPRKGSEETKFRMFGGGEVFSKHTSGFFVRESHHSGKISDKVIVGVDDDRGVRERVGELVDKDWKMGGGYLYNGLVAAKGNVRGFTNAMEQATELVEREANALIRARWKKKMPAEATKVEEGREKFESPIPWSTNAAFVNCYDGGGENVGWHADQLTYLGPMATIASVSLGVGREFGLKKEGDEGGVIKIWLPHNSLLVMEAGAQESWKHCIFPSHAISRHPISGSKRINITYRCYRPSLAPRYTPRCKCPLPGVLRTVMDKNSENWGRYFWHCQGGYQGKGENGGGCGWFEWAKLDQDGELEGWRERTQKHEQNGC